MPELPEVEVTRLGFAPAIAGARIASLRLGKPLRWPMGCDAASLVGQRVHGVRRRNVLGTQWQQRLGRVLDVSGGQFYQHPGVGRVHPVPVGTVRLPVLFRGVFD